MCARLTFNYITQPGYIKCVIRVNNTSTTKALDYLLICRFSVALLSYFSDFLPAFLQIIDLSAGLSGLPCNSFAGNVYICHGKHSSQNIGRRRHHICTDDSDICPATCSMKLFLMLKEKTVKYYCL